MSATPDPRVVESRWASRHAVWGALFVLAVASLYAFALPAAVRDGATLEADQPYPVVAGLEMTPGAGWELKTQNDLLSSLAKDGAVMLIAAPRPRDDVDQDVRNRIEDVERDANEHWEVFEPDRFTTDAGDAGLEFGAHSASRAQQTWIVVHDGWKVTVVGSAPSSVWPTLSNEMEEMVRSVLFTGGDE